MSDTTTDTKPYLSAAIQHNLITRLNRIEGQVRGVKKMIERHDPCDAILLQIASLRAALMQAGRILLDDHIRCCVIEAVKHGDAEEELMKLAAALDRLLK